MARLACRMQRPAMGEPAPRLAVAAPVSADLLLTCDVPAMDLSVPRGTVPMTARGQRTRYLRSPDDVTGIAGVCARCR